MRGHCRVTFTAQTTGAKHPFQKFFEELEVGETLITGTRTITNEDVIEFANLSGDKFYAHIRRRR